MPTLLDTAAFALAKTTLDETLQRIEKARQDRLESVRKILQTCETDLERVNALIGTRTPGFGSSSSSG